jgi:tRNA modification GTPase
VAVIRVSGPAVPKILQAVAGCLPEPRRASLRLLRHPATGEALDRALVLRFGAPASYTGEEAAELHVHGGRAVIEAVAAALVACGPGVRPAEPGEFTRRAFLNGRLDLTAAEGIADLVAAETEAQRRQALAQAEGGLARRLEAWGERLTRALALAEAAIDFSDEGVGEEAEREALALAREVAREMSVALAGAGSAERVREGVRVAIIGAPNAGKSSLLNRLVGREAAIVSARAGTTRDVIEVRMDLGGHAVTLADTAGLREAADEIEAEGVRRALAWAQEAEVVVGLFDCAAGVMDEATCAALARHGGIRIGVASKADLGAFASDIEGLPLLPVSAVTGEGIEALVEALTEAVRRCVGNASGEVVLTRARHRAAVEAAHAALERCSGAWLPELRGEELRTALREIGRLTGRVDVEDLLDQVFRTFCIGK